MWNMWKKSPGSIIEVSEGEKRENRLKGTFKEVIVENFSKLIKNHQAIYLINVTEWS